MCLMPGRIQYTVFTHPRKPEKSQITLHYTVKLSNIVFFLNNYTIYIFPFAGSNLSNEPTRAEKQIHFKTAKHRDTQIWYDMSFQKHVLQYVATTASSAGPSHQSKSYLLRVHGGCAKGVDDYHVGSSVGVDEVAPVALPQAVHHTGFIQVEQWSQVLWSVVWWRVGLHRERWRRWHSIINK